MSVFEWVVFMEIFLFLQSRKTFLWFNWNFLLIEFHRAINFLFLKNWLVTFSSCLRSNSFAIKVECFMLWYHFINFALIDYWCFVRGVLLSWHCSITDMYNNFHWMLLISCSRKSNHLPFFCLSALVFFFFKYYFCLILLIRHNIEWR